MVQTPAHVHVLRASLLMICKCAAGLNSAKLNDLGFMPLARTSQVPDRNVAGFILGACSSIVLGSFQVGPVGIIFAGSLRG